MWGYDAGSSRLASYIRLRAQLDWSGSASTHSICSLTYSTGACEEVARMGIELLG